MQKGFTLIELLIVMVVVGILVSVSLPKYYASMERGRSMEGISNLRAASDAVNAKYVLNGNPYPNSLSSTNLQDIADLTKSQYFSAPVITRVSSVFVEIQIGRLDGTYALRARNSQGSLQYIQCGGSADTCLNLGMELSDGIYKMDFSK